MNKTSFFIALFVINVWIYSAEYTISSIGAELLSNEHHDPRNGDQWNVEGINNEGKIIGEKRITNTLTVQGRSEIFIFDPKNGLSFFEKSINNSIPPRYIHKLKLNNLGQFVGYGYFENIGQYKAFIWTKSLGFHFIEIKNLDVNNTLGFNDLGQIIWYSSFWNGEHYIDKSFIWNNGVMTEIGADTEFAKQFEKLGFHVIGIRLVGINNKGELVGYFSQGKYNELQKRYIFAGYKHFYWNGDIHLISLPKNMMSPLKEMIVNDQGQVLINAYKETYIWDSQNKLRLIPNFHGEAINNQGIVLGTVENSLYGQKAATDDKSIPAIWKEGKITELKTLLDVDDLTDLAPAFADDYSVEAIREIKGLNNKGQITCKGLVWGRWYPFILEPHSNY